MERDESLKITTERVRELTVCVTEIIGAADQGEVYRAILLCLVREMRGALTTAEVAYGLAHLLSEFLEHHAQEDNVVKNMFPRGPNGIKPENN